MILPELLDKSWIRVGLGPLPSDHRENGIIVVVELAHQVGNGNGGASTDSGHTVDEDVAGSAVTVDEVEGLFEKWFDTGAHAVLYLDD